MPSPKGPYIEIVYPKNPSSGRRRILQVQSPPICFGFGCFLSLSVLHLKFIALQGMNNTISFLPLGMSAIFPGALQLSPSMKDYLKSAPFWLRKLTQLLC